MCWFTKRKDPRSGRRLGADELSRLDGLVSPRIGLGQSVHHIHATDPEVAAICSERTLRRILRDGLLSAKAHELRRYARFKRRLPGGKEARRLVVSDVRKLLGRMHQDYLDCVASNREAPTCQLDSVIGKAEEAKAILTITWPESNFQVGLLIDKGRPESARKAILKAMRAVAKACPGKPFPMRREGVPGQAVPDGGLPPRQRDRVPRLLEGRGGDGRRRNLRQDLLREALQIRKVDKRKVRLLPAI